jgi:hypothetical protein
LAEKITACLRTTLNQIRDVLRCTWILLRELNSQWLHACRIIVVRLSLILPEGIRLRFGNSFLRRIGGECLLAGHLLLQDVVPLLLRLRLLLRSLFLKPSREEVRED